MLEHILHLHMHVNSFSYWLVKEKYPTTNRIGSNTLGRHKENDIYIPEKMLAQRRNKEGKFRIYKSRIWEMKTSSGGS